VIVNNFPENDNGYLSSTFTENNNVLPKLPIKLDDKIELNYVHFKSDLVCKLLRILKAKTSSGRDLLPALLLKKLARSLSLLLHYLN